MHTGEIVKTYNSKTKQIEYAEIVDIHYRVKSSFDDYIYPILVDVKFLRNQELSKGHIFYLCEAGIYPNN